MAYPAYNTYNPTYYQPPMPDQLAQLRQTQQYQPYVHPQQNGMIWVQGEAGAKSYLIAAGNTVPLWDSENQTIYIKSVDASGIPSMRIIDYTERTQNNTVLPVMQPKGNEYVTRAEFDALAAKFDDFARVAKEGVTDGEPAV